MVKQIINNPIVRGLWLGVVLLFGIGITFSIYVSSEIKVNQANERRISAIHLSYELLSYSENQTRLARTYVITADTRYRDAYHEMMASRDGRLAVPLENENFYWSPTPALHAQLSEQNLSLQARMSQQDFDSRDIAFLYKAKSLTDELSDTEISAMAMVDSLNGKLDINNHPAIDMLYSDKYQKTKALILWNIKTFGERTEMRKTKDVNDAKERALRLSYLFGLLSLIFLLTIWRINRSLHKIMGGSVARVFEAIRQLNTDDVNPKLYQHVEGATGILPKLAKSHAQLIEGRQSRKLLNDALQNALSDFRRAQKVARIGSWSFDIATEDIHWSDEMFRIFGMAQNAPIKLAGFFNIIHAEDRQFVTDSWNRALEGEKYDIRHRILVNGDIQWVRARAEFEFTDDGRPLRGIGTCQLITKQVLAEQRIQLLASVFTSAHEGIIITDLNARIIETNRAFSKITGYSREEVIGKTPGHFSSGRHGREFYESMWEKIKADGYWSGEIWNRRKSGDVYPELLAISTVLDERGNPSNFIGLFTDISQQKEQQRQLEYNAYYDGLTGLPNRVLLTDRLQLEMAKCQRDGKKLAIAFIDLDGFKEVNDEYGHEAGDHVLITVAERITNCLRAHETVARLGGDEFVAVITGLTTEQESLPVINRILASIAMPIKHGDFSLSVHASIGTTFFPQTIEYDGEQLLRQADQAMYHAKQAGRNRFQIFDEAYDRDLRMHNENLERAKQGLANSEFELYYQPKVNMASGEIIGIEALARWNHPERGLLAPGEFLPDLQDTVLEIPFGDWVIDQALVDCGLLRQNNITLTISVNISARHLENPDFVQKLKTRLDNCSCKQLCGLELEILETSALEDLERVFEIIRECETFGVNFSLDDFGTGYSSLTYLRMLPVGTLKIDQSFVRGITERPEDVIMLKGMLDLARGLGRKVIAEGVETLEHGRILLEIGCMLGQGYAIAKPMPFTALLQWMKTWHPDPSWENRSAWR